MRCAMAGCMRARRWWRRRAAPGSERGLLCAAAGPAVCGGDAAQHVARKIAQIEFHGGRCHLVDSAGEVYAAARAVGGGDGRALHGPVHLCRAGHRLAGQQQHCREHVHPDGARAAPRCRAGLWWAQARAAPAPPLAVMCATSGTPRRCAWPTRRVRCSAPTTARAMPA